MMEMRSSLAQSTAPELNDGEDVGSLGRGATPSSGEAPGPTHAESGGVRWLGTDGVVENRGLLEADKGTGTDEMQREGLLL
jgi:hypothetical protein